MSIVAGEGSIAPGASAAEADLAGAAPTVGPADPAVLATAPIEAAGSVSLAAAAAAARAASAAAADAKRSSNPSSAVPGGGPPDPVGGLPRDGRAAFGEWVLPRALRATFGFNYQSVQVSQALGRMDERQRGGVVGVATAFAVLDPRILTIDFAGELQLSGTTSRSPLASFRNGNGLTSYRVDFGILAGLKAPLRVFADRISSNSHVEPSGLTLDPARHTRGLHQGLGFTWDVNVDRLPRIQVSASAGRQDDERNYLFGYSSRNDERRAEVRASRDHSRVRYDVNVAHGDVVYAVPDAGVRSETASDLLQATGRFRPSSRLDIDVHARASRFQFGVGGRDSQVSGAGAEGAARYHLRENLTASARYSVLEQRLRGRAVGRARCVAARRDAGHDRDATAGADAVPRRRGAPGVRHTEPDSRRLHEDRLVRRAGVPVPDALRDHNRRRPSARRAQLARGLLARRSGRVCRYRAVESRRPAALPRSGGRSRHDPECRRLAADRADATIRQVVRLAFFPVNLESRNANVRVETMRPGWARARATATRYDNLRDVLYSDSRDRHTGYSLGLAGNRYDLSLEVDQTDTHSLLLAPAVLGSRPDVAILVASRPELFRNLLATGDSGSALSLQVRPLSGLHVEVRGRRQNQVYPGLVRRPPERRAGVGDYQIRDVQLEVGWEYFESSTSFGDVRDRRLYVRVRRDITFF